MTGIQVSLFQLDNYGPWTVTPEPRPEPDLQALQARLYADVAAMIGSRSGYVFYTRFDNMVAVTNGIDREDHRSIQRTIANRYPITISIGIGTGETPAAALADATERLQSAGSAQDATRTEVLAGPPLVEDDRTAGGDRTGETVTVAHFDVVDVTGKYTDRVDAYDAHLRVQEATHSLARHLYDATGSLAFFVGGDNVIAVCPPLPIEAYRAAIDHVERDVGVEFQVGVGTGETAIDAGMEAKHALERCRRDGTRIEGLPATVAGD